MCNQSSPYTLEPSLQAQLCSPKHLLWHQVSQYLSPPSLGWMTSCAANGPLKYTLERHGSEKIPFLKERNLAKDAVVPGKQKPAEIWLSSLAPHRVVSCKTKKIPPPRPEGKVLERAKQGNHWERTLSPLQCVWQFAYQPCPMVFTLGDKCEVQGTDTSITGDTKKGGTTGNMADN